MEQCCHSLRTADQGRIETDIVANCRSRARSVQATPFALPRLPLDDLANPRYIVREADRLAEMLLADRRDLEAWATQPKSEILIKRDVTVQPCESEVVKGIHERFHYIRAYHPGCAHFGLFLRSRREIPAALASFSLMDIRHLEWLYASASERARVWVLTRLFAFDWAPPNSISFLLAQVCKWVRRNSPGVTTFLTYVNPNVGFSGSSFLAANWRPFLEKLVRYAYLDDKYITDRKLTSLPASALMDITASLYRLESLRILRYTMTEEPGGGGKGKQ
jgi:hypothetical protein